MSDAVDTPPEPLRPRMGRLTVVFLVVVAAGVIAGGALLGGGQDGSGTPGSDAPEVTVALFDGSEWRLTEHLATDGRPVVLNLWASWCGPCRAEIPELDEYAAQTPEVLVLGAAVEDREPSARALAAELGPAYPMGMAVGDLRADYPTPGLPATFVIDGDGVIRATWFGPITKEGLIDLVGPVISS